jgi:hypothetical protein
MRLLFFAPRAIDLGELAAALAAIPGLDLDGRPGQAYRPGTWRDLVTGARCAIDLGAPPVEDDHQHPPRTYEGWLVAPLAIAIPLAGPHWLAVEAMSLVERLLAGVPGLAALDEEDADGGPSPWSRPRAVASWHRQQTAFLTSRPNHPRLNRNASLALWRYRRERPAGLVARPELAWPEAMVLGERRHDGGIHPYAAALWRDGDRALALPPVDLVVAMRPAGPAVIAANRLRCLPGTTPLDHGRALLIPMCPAAAACFARGEARPVEAFAALGDEDWTD